MKNKPRITAYLCGPITNLPNNNRGAFRTARRDVEKLGYSTIMPHDLFLGYDTSDYTHSDYMRRCIRALMHAKILVLLPGWELSEGAQIEIQIAGLIGIPKVVIHELNPLPVYSKKRSALWERWQKVDAWFTDNFEWFFSPSKNYKNQNIER